MLEREVKLAFSSSDEARAAFTAARAIPLRPRRLQHDVLFDTDDQQLRLRGCALRIRHENGAGVLTFKGPVAKGTMKVREEFETEVGNPESLRQVLEALGFHPWFTYEKEREEYELAGVVAAIDDTPVGTFVELEGAEDHILRATSLLERRPDEFILASYRSLFLARRDQWQLSGDDMVFARR
jgi:adenylate cyclase class 2